MKSETKIANKRILITGGAGFIGSNLIEYFLNNNKVVCLDNLSTGFYENIEHLIGNPAFDFIKGDIREIGDCRAAVKDCDYVFHHAALGSVPRSINDPLSTNASNIDGFLNMLVASRDEGITRFIYAASSSTYGDSKELPKIEHRIGRALSPYAITKYVNELYAEVFTELYGIETVGLRYFNVFGKRQSPRGEYAAVIPLWVKHLIMHESPLINGDGNFSRDFTYIENVLHANEQAALIPWTTINERLEEYQKKNQLQKFPGRTFNIAYGGNTTLNELFYLIRDNLARFDQSIVEIEPTHGPQRTGDIPHSLACTDKAGYVLDYRPAFDARSGLKEAAEWYFNNLKPV